MNLTTMTYSVADGFAHVRLTRPERANAVDEAFAADLRSVVDSAAVDDSVTVVSVTAEGQVFCAGGDLKAFHNAGANLPSLAAEIIDDLHAAIVRMNSLDKPFIAGVRGAAGGAGLSLVSAFDFVISGESAKYTMAYTRAGVTPDGLASYFLPRHIGVRRMLDLTLTNRVLSAVEAEAWGLVNRVVPDADVEGATTAMARHLAAGATRALGAAKGVVYFGVDHNISAASDHERETIIDVMRGPDAQEGVAAFVEKRPGSFLGR